MLLNGKASKITQLTKLIHIGQVRLMEYFAGIFCMQIIPPKTEYFAKHSSVKWNYLLQIIPFLVEYFACKKFLKNIPIDELSHYVIVLLKERH